MIGWGGFGYTLDYHVTDFNTFSRSMGSFTNDAREREI